MKRVLKILNPFIWLFNFFGYMAHLQHWSELEGFARKRGEHHKYEPYDYSKDLNYF